MNRKTDVLDLFENPMVRRGESEIRGELISITMGDDGLERVDAIDSAEAELKEPVDSTTTEFDLSTLRGRRIVFDFVAGELDKITCWGEAYSWYYPSARGKAEYSENSASGDTIIMTIVQERLEEVDIIGGAVGSYLSGEERGPDTARVMVIDTINYNARTINFNLEDSLITLKEASHVTSGSVALDAYRIEFATDDRMIYGYSGEVDTLSDDHYLTLSDELQPNTVPVLLKDGDDEILGDYLEYSLETQKGRILKSKSNYENGYYYGSKVFRSNKDIFYIKDGTYSTCDADDPHFHFQSSNMKMMEGDKLLAKPVVLYVGRLPVFALPFYVFPLRHGRRSGFLPFSIGNIERGERYINNVGYYWAASEYFDWQTAIDYHERNRSVTIFNRLNYNKRYVFNGFASASYTKQTNYASARETTDGVFLGGEGTFTRWALRGSHYHQISPSFKISGTGSYQSDATYYNDFSTDLSQRLNRNVRSQVNFSKRFGRRVTLSGSFKHDQNLDTEDVSDNLPTMSLSLPSINPFGEGSLDEDGRLQQSWYNKIILRYSPSFQNFSSGKQSIRP
ncbi:MAG: LPS assembly protein LptD, partial [candidate division Zixibacteria bacterium]